MTVPDTNAALISLANERRALTDGATVRHDPRMPSPEPRDEAAQATPEKGA